MQDYVKINPADCVAVALRPLPAGLTLSVGGEAFFLKEDIPQGHKFAIRAIQEGQPVIKYGSPIGTAKVSIPQGSWVHTHNIQTRLGSLLSYTYEKTSVSLPASPPAYFQGYPRAGGKAGIRNEIWIIPTVGCVNSVAAAISKQAQVYKTGTIEDIVAFSHPYGCSQMGGDQENTRKILTGLIRHPNAGGVLVLGLGCENTGIRELKSCLGVWDDNRVKFLEAQESEDEIADALSLIRELAAYAGDAHRKPIPSSELVIGLKCGGSDGLSGITANPTVGYFSDLLISQGGTTILTEVPEMFGAETHLMNRCENKEVFQQTVDLINGFKQYFTDHHQTVYENPSPGNKMGGISTLEDKSMGCVQKSGTAPVCGVLAYGEPVKKTGLNLLDAPGNDLVASTALAASGAHMVLFTTGRGTPFASPVPTVKISSSSQLFHKKQNWIDFNCGTLVEGTSLQTLGHQLFDYVLAAASGEQTKAETAGFHDMAIFKQGVTL